MRVTIAALQNQRARFPDAGAGWSEPRSRGAVGRAVRFRACSAPPDTCLHALPFLWAMVCCSLLGAPFPCRRFAPRCLPAVVIFTLAHRFSISVFPVWPLIVAWWRFAWEFGCCLPLKCQRALAPLVGFAVLHQGIVRLVGGEKTPKPFPEPLEL